MAESSAVPVWLNDEFFAKVLEANLDNFSMIRDFVVLPAFAAGENYLSILWSIEVDTVLKDGCTKLLKYMLKMPPTSPQALAITNMLQSFKRELIAYNELLPAFEALYSKCGYKIQIAPKALKITDDLGLDVILMEDARMAGYQTMNRLEGLDAQHTKWALKKLAQFHAASAMYIAEKGSLPALLMQPFYGDEIIELLDEKQKPQEYKFLQNLSIYKAEHMRDKILKYQKIYVKQLRENISGSVQNPQDFHVFSHGDCWSNNILFRHDEKTAIADVLFVDFQVGRYVTPAIDLQYFLLSCPNLDIKIRYFDHFVQHYHQELVKHLNILNYPKQVPTLNHIHKSLYKTSFMAYTVILKSLPVFLLDPSSTNDISMENMMGDKSNSSDMQHVMYTNERYAKHLQEILPWMENRGYFE